MISILLNIITASGTIVTTISIVSMFILYKIEKRDEYVAKVRVALQTLQNNMEELNQLLDYELAYELVYALLYAESSQLCIKKLYKISNNSISEKIDKGTAVESIKTTLGVFGVSFRCDLAIRYNGLISELKKQSIIFYPQYEGLFRFSKACTTLMRNVFVYYSENVPLFRRNGYRKSGTMILRVRSRDTALK